MFEYEKNESEKRTQTVCCSKCNMRINKNTFSIFAYPILIGTLFSCKTTLIKLIFFGIQLTTSGAWIFFTNQIKAYSFAGCNFCKIQLVIYFNNPIFISVFFLKFLLLSLKRTTYEFYYISLSTTRG